ncbi:MAG: hypothetical protein ACM31C_34890 [Acidobacteriota bacterium]
MVGHKSLRRALPLVLLAACGGGGKKTASKPVVNDDHASKAPPPETEADREKKRHDEATKIVPEGSSCLPVALKDDGAPRLDLAAIGKDAIVCAVDTDKSRLLGVVGCWKVDLGSGGLTYQDPRPLPGHDIDVKLTDNCARGFCLPKDAKGGDVAHMAWNLDGSKVAVLVGDSVHVFDAKSKEHQGQFAVTGDKGVTGDASAVYFVGDSIFVEGGEQGKPFTGVWQFKTDGTAQGPLVGIGKDDKPLSTYHGSFSILDQDHVGIAERGFTTMTSYEVSNGKRAKAVRKLPKIACKAAELDAYWTDGDKVTDKCKGSATTAFAPLIGATAVMGKTNLLVMLRDDRLGELAVVNPKSLAEDPKKLIKMPWCTGNEGAAKPEAADKGDAGDDKPAKSEKSTKKTRGAVKKDKAKTGDPDEGGE